MPLEYSKNRILYLAFLIASQTLLSAIVLKYIYYFISPSPPDASLKFCLAYCAPPSLCFWCLEIIRFQKSVGSQESKGNASAVYNLDHARLNVVLPPEKMWMNMGYWIGTNDFQSACKELLKEVLEAAGFLTPVGHVKPLRAAKRTTILDLGFGCGDQSLYIISKLMRTPLELSLMDEAMARRSINRGVDAYVGITLDPTQFTFAQERLKVKGKLSHPLVHIFCADAGRTRTWPAELIKRVKALSMPSPTAKEGEDDVDCWVLALDTLYHFKPSRNPIFQYAHQELDASIMAYDIILSDNQSLLTRFVLHILGLFMGVPLFNFMTEREYRAKLVSAGYEDERIEIRDISEHVFAPLTKFLVRREKVLKKFGWGLGKLKAAKWLFGWWARSKVVKGVIVIARK
ncbi:hypothetical protein EJ08DRAFT_200485 [Tothia fuscella]|uniref:Methyltransferase domain-containing protein n=1 Tax=Tothia fuscella TaxID=1048955 RepID=A0A9P4NT19_9PEZI|nr:hypothetical protein EJ08DRAFT_200485 [Tothia fuscella]